MKLPAGIQYIGSQRGLRWQREGGNTFHQDLPPRRSAPIAGIAAN
jgi:hypothetical protein